MSTIKILQNTHSVKSIKHYSYGILRFRKSNRKIKIEQNLPFRIKFTNIGIVSNYGPGNAAPIGIAVIGVNNYVM
jgi:hypothetical protein